MERTLTVRRPPRSCAGFPSRPHTPLLRERPAEVPVARPAATGSTQLRRLGTLLKDVRCPRDNVAELRAHVDRFESATRVL